VLLFEGLDVLTEVPRLENDGLQWILREDYFYQLDPKHAGMDIVCHYEVVAAFEVAPKRVIAVCCCLNLYIGIEVLKKGSKHFPGILVVLNQQDSHALIMLVFCVIGETSLLRSKPFNERNGLISTVHLSALSFDR
jgi:hypothetical protein